jgi:hypothetical protein
MKFDDLVARVAERRLVGGKDQFLKPAHPHCEGCEVELDLAAVGLAFVQELGLHVGRDGHVHNPVPAPSFPDQTRAVRYRGQARGRGRR